MRACTMGPERPPPRGRGTWLLLLTVLAGASILSSWAVRSMAAAPAVSYAQFRRMLAAGEVSEVWVSREAVKGVRKSGSRFETVRIEDPGLFAEMQARGAKMTAATEGRRWMEAVVSALPLLLIAWLFFQRGPQSGAMLIGATAGRQNS